MASELPRLIVQNFNVLVDGTSYIGQASELELPELKAKTEEVRNAGMLGPVEVPMGYEKLEAKLKMTALDMGAMSLFGIAPGKRVSILASAALVDHDGTTHSLVATGWALCKMAKIDALKAGEKKSEHSWEFSYDEYTVELDGQEYMFVSPFEVRMRGRSISAGIRRAILA
jgi:P2 family phage contractile tail tube protein